MNEKRAREILGEAIESNDELGDNGEAYICWNKNRSTVTLDGRFTPEELVAIVWWMKNKKAAALDEAEARGAQRFTQFHHNPIVAQLQAELAELRVELAAMPSVTEVVLAERRMVELEEQLAAAKVEGLRNALSLLKEISVEMHHARTFIDTRERIFTMGLMQYDEVVQKLDAEIAALERGEAEGCHGCGQVLTFENLKVADGCPCNSPRGINHGIVPKTVCTCVQCDPEQTGASRWGSRPRPRGKGE